AHRDGDRVYAVIGGLGSATDWIELGPPASPDPGEAAARLAIDQAGVPAASIGLLEESGPTLRGDPRGGRGDCSSALGSLQADIGQAGAAGGLLSVAKAALCLHLQILPPSPTDDRSRREAACLSKSFPTQAQFWLR